MRPLRLIVACILSVAALSACADDAADDTPPVAAADPADSDADDSDPADSDADDSDADGGDADGADDVSEPTDGEVTQLTGVVGTPDEPDAFEITLVGADGEVVKQLPAGRYVIDVNDLSDIHNWHLFGPGEVDVQTPVDAVTSETFEVTLEPGEYTYICDPHTSSMTGTFEVV